MLKARSAFLLTARKLPNSRMGCTARSLAMKAGLFGIAAIHRKRNLNSEVDPILWTKKGHSLATLLPVFLIGNVLQLDFLSSRDWPAGSAKAVGLIVIMLISVTFYLWTINRGRRTRDVSML